MRGFLGLCSGVCFGGTRFGQSRMILILCMLGFWMIYSSGVRAMPGPSPPAPCGTLDLMSPLTQHCFPEDGSHHFVCCIDIQMPENPHSPHGNFNPLERVIKEASNSSSYSWCTCSEEICTEQLQGKVAWNQNGIGWKGFAPPRFRGDTRANGHQGLGPFNARTGLPDDGSCSGGSFT